ncbi:hypothetical protein NBRC116495_22500 [Aurantivibrio plasticivorans]
MLGQTETSEVSDFWGIGHNGFLVYRKAQTARQEKGDKCRSEKKGAGVYRK